jgi:hypothetical protein
MTATAYNLYPTRDQIIASLRPFNVSYDVLNTFDTSSLQSMYDDLEYCPPSQYYICTKQQMFVSR